MPSVLESSWWRRAALVSLVVLAVVSFILLPFGEVKDETLDALPWVGLGILISEIVLTIGIVGMASVAGVEGMRARLSRKALKGIDWGEIADRIDRSRLFWASFWLSLVGGLGDGIVIIAGIGSALPPRSWGLMILPFLDVIATVGIRYAIHRAVRSRGET